MEVVGASLWVVANVGCSGGVFQEWLRGKLPPTQSQSTAYPSSSSQRAMAASAIARCVYGSM